MVVVPTPVPVTTPEVPIVATPGLLLAHTPPVVASLSVVVLPIHVVRVPVIVASKGNGLTVNGVVAIQPVPTSV